MASTPTRNSIASRSARWTTLALLAAIGLPSALASAEGEKKVDTIKESKFVGKGMNVGDKIRATFTVKSGNNTASYDIEHKATADKFGDAEVSFEKPTGLVTVTYTNVETTERINGSIKGSAGQVIFDMLNVGDRFPLFSTATRSLNTITVVDLYHPNPALNIGDSFMFIAGVNPALPGTFVRMGNAPYSGTAILGGFNTVSDVPAPGPLMLVAGGAALMVRRRR